VIRNIYIRQMDEGASVVGTIWINMHEFTFTPVRKYIQLKLDISHSSLNIAILIILSVLVSLQL